MHPRLEGVVKMLIILRFDFEDHRITKQVVFEPESRAVSVDIQPVLKSREFARTLVITDQFRAVIAGPGSTRQFLIAQNSPAVTGCYTCQFGVYQVRILKACQQMGLA